MFKVYVQSVDGTHLVGKHETLESAREIVFDWLGDAYNEVGKNSWIGMYGDNIYIQEVDHPTGMSFFEWTEKNYGYDEADYNCNDNIKGSQWKEWHEEYKKLKEGV